MADTPRPPAVAGQFYPRDAKELAREIESCFESSRGPGALPSRHRSADRFIRAAIVPHAGYRFSGPIAALAFSAIASERPPEHILILGVDHHGAARGPSISGQSWLTPLGPVPCDPALARALTVPPLRRDDGAHDREHSIEVELPFLQYVLPEPTFTAVMIPFAPYAELADIGRVIREAIAGWDVLLIASTDFSHYIPPQTAEQLDRRAIDQILRGRAAGLYETVEHHRISMCGIAPTTVLLAALEDEELRPRLLGWGHSGQAETMTEVVGYASLLFDSETPLAPGGSAG
ncbi:MAG: AmmeMemoRadiSam system protein B [Thermoplasmata archaeon]|nr:AmmeMemoRadiSam system protein B [Thermoplasmata archaeon]